MRLKDLPAEHRHRMVSGEGYKNICCIEGSQEPSGLCHWGTLPRAEQRGRRALVREEAKNPSPWLSSSHLKGLA
ncbi:hypothetical protein NHX12_021670 [Muraenolepis orangiensis]|uniref:Uncharacterized protein n=1 Tax=Muraenolepis orangiensis TaxID=630683 RepID=A0A9Q0EQK0_9TELE|nr:hypothetical protein NHX12_021670 [Muraenolepis orangiensis]